MSWLSPLEIIARLNDIIDPEQDYVMITEAEEFMKSKAAVRLKATEESRAQISSLNREVQKAKLSATRPPGVPNEKEHIAMMNELEDQRLQFGKMINDGEGLLASKEAELMRLREEERALEDKDVASDHDLDSTALRLQICRSLGFEPVMKDGNVVKILVRSESNEVHTVSFKDGKSEQDHTQLLWELASS
ncbi:hypothetical protein M422DRAFT_47619 [Sphaerobolus stellatus SS14]|uniref:Kinetochore protein Spc24 n=1 Tax=Sphaerobolus stellatus (strain SS14) TaxID=990650 RepID=A0A0C9UM51_SPHS4|nr:hypothetical protein M422DRAFT_47619 [Sphaerobolus stellatus SS14]